MPLFSAGRSRDQFWNTLTAAEYKKVPATVMRKASVLAVNVWDVCGRKKTSRPNYEMPPVIMRTIMSFIGDKLEDGARYDPRVSGAALKAHAEAAQQKICDEILQNLSKFLTPYAMRGTRVRSFPDGDQDGTGTNASQQNRNAGTAVGAEPSQSKDSKNPDPNEPNDIIDLTAENNGFNQTTSTGGGGGPSSTLGQSGHSHSGAEDGPTKKPRRSDKQVRGAGNPHGSYRTPKKPGDSVLKAPLIRYANAEEIKAGLSLGITQPYEDPEELQLEDPP
eukprot:g6418.t1